MNLGEGGGERRKEEKNNNNTTTNTHTHKPPPFRLSIILLSLSFLLSSSSSNFFIFCSSIFLSFSCCFAFFIFNISVTVARNTSCVVGAWAEGGERGERKGEGLTKLTSDPNKALQRKEKGEEKEKKQTMTKGFIKVSTAFGL